MNKKYQQLNTPYNPKEDVEFIDYNNWVDDILNISPPYHTNAHYEPSYQTQQNSQLSIIPRRKKVKTIPFDASPHQIEWENAKKKNQEPVDILLGRNTGINWGVSKSKESVVSVNNIIGRSQTSNKSDVKLFGKSQDLGADFQNSLNKLYGLKNIGDNPPNPADFNVDSLFGSNVNGTPNLFLKDKPNTRARAAYKSSNLNFKNSLSGLSFNSFEPSDMKIKDTPGVFHGTGTNAPNNFALGGDQMIKITARDLNQFDIINEESDPPSPNNSLGALFKIDQTPALFRGNSGIIDPKTLKRK